MHVCNFIIIRIFRKAEIFELLCRDFVRDGQDFVRDGLYLSSKTHLLSGAIKIGFRYPIIKNKNTIILYILCTV